MKRTSVDEDEESTTVVPFRKSSKLALGSKDPPGDSWLWKLEDGTRFLARSKIPWEAPVHMLFEFKVEAKGDKSVFLMRFSPNTMTYWVDPFEFSKSYALYEVLEAPGE